MISNFQCRAVTGWDCRRLCLKTLYWKLLLRCQFSNKSLCEHHAIPQVDVQPQRKRANRNPARSEVKGLGGRWFRRLAQCDWSSSRIIAGMEWPCPRCTFVNKGELQECELCGQPFISEAGVHSDDRAVTGFPMNGQIRGEDCGLEWACSTCTFVNYGQQPACQICGEGRVDAAEVPVTELPLANSFRPLRRVPRPCEPDGFEELSVPIVHEQEPNVKLEKCSEVVQPETSRGIESTGASESQTSDKTSPLEREEPNSRKRNLEASSLGQDGGSNSLLKMLHDERMKRNAKSNSLGKNDDDKATQPAMKQKRAKGSMATDSVQDSSNLVFMFYNVWFKEEIEVYSRMAAIGKLIDEHQPHVICFQEVTENIYDIFQKSSWWKQYACSVSPHLASQRAYFTMQLCKLSASFRRNPFRNSVMGRELCLADLDVGAGKQIVIATTHLESPCPGPPTWDQMFSKERVQQAVEALSTLNTHPNTIFGGDMNWNDKLDGPPPLPGGWADAWLELKPSEPGYTYDSKTNPMLGGGRCLRSRLDRIFCHLVDFTLESIEMVGLQEIPGVTYEKEKKIRKQVQLITLPVLPSDHFGLVLKIRRKEDND